MSTNGIIKQVACEYDRHVDYGKKRIHVRCEDCNQGNKELSDRTCLASLIDIILKEYNVNDIILSGPIEKQYVKDGIKLIKYLARMVNEIRGMSQKDPIKRAVSKFPKKRKEISKMCSSCDKNPETIFDRFENVFKSNYGEFIQSVRKESKDHHKGKGKSYCDHCRDSTRADCKYLLKKSMDLSDLILYSAYNLIVRDGKKEKIKYDDKVKEEVVLTPGGPPKIIKDTDEEIEDQNILKDLGSVKSRTDESAEEFYDSVNYRMLNNGIVNILNNNKFIRPSFSSSWLRKEKPSNSHEMNRYRIGGTSVKHYYLPDSMESLYYLSSRDYEVDEEEATLIKLTIDEMAEKYPEEISIEDRGETREYILSASKDIMMQIARRKGLSLGDNRDKINKNLDKLTAILGRHTAGLGILESVLKDIKVEDVYVDAPAPANPLYIKLDGGTIDKMSNICRTNIILGKDDIDSILSRFRMESGRPFSESNPVLEYNMDEFGIRVTIIGKPLSPEGVALALRRHSDEPWTLLRLIENGTITPLAAGLFSFLIDGRSTILVAGSRGAGKTSLLGALMLEFPTSQRLLTIEDTLELPSRVMQEHGYKVQNILVRSGFSGVDYEKSPEEALRVSLRLGESAIIMGEVRGEEARTLYEAMRAGTAGSSVLGTFHANSPSSVFERAVYDIGVPAKSFGATDVVAIANLKRPGGRQKPVRRLTQISELDKETIDDGIFRDLMTYDSNKNRIVETDVLKYSSQVIGRIAREWDMSLEEAYKNIEVRGRYRKTIVDRARRDNLPVLLSTEWVKKTNTAFWNCLTREQRKGGKTDYCKVMKGWKKWFEESVRYA